MESINQFLTNKEAADLVFFCLSTVTLWRLRRKGQILLNRIANEKILFRKSDLERYLKCNSR